ncbi:glycosyltransferase, partial [bacterium]|nr:glycosyltransferase [bacterium]
HKETYRYYKQAKALLCPIRWEEPFGLTFIEAMACGTPVIVFDKGSAREVVKDGKTGFIVKDFNEMITAVKKIDQIDRKECRKHVEQNFTVEKMVGGYEQIYYKILRK